MRGWLALVFLALFVCSFYGGRKVTLKTPKWGNPLAAVCLAFILLHLLLFYSPMLEFSLIGWYGYIFIQPWWMPVFAFGLLGTAMGLMAEKRKRYAVMTLTGVLGIFYLMRMSATTFLQAQHLSGTPVGTDQVCMQTTGYTCGAAAACTLLAQVRIAATEQEMADICGTNSMNGTQVVGVMWGLREKLKDTGYRIEFLDRQTPADLQALQYPAMVTMRLNFLIDHWIVVLKADENGILTADPLRGVVRRNTGEFLSNWRRTLVKLVPRDPDHPPPLAIDHDAPPTAPESPSPEASLSPASEAVAGQK